MHFLNKRVRGPKPQTMKFEFIKILSSVAAERPKFGNYEIYIAKIIVSGSKLPILISANL